MQFTHTNMISGLFTKGFEFIATERNKVKVFHDERILSFDNLPDFVYDTIKKEMKSPLATMAEMEEYAFKRWGGLDSQLDIDENGVVSNAEYLPDVAPAFFDCGKKISDAELRVLKLVYLEDKTIAEKLYISHFTVARHFQSLYINSGINKRTELALWAKSKGII